MLLDRLSLFVCGCDLLKAENIFGAIIRLLQLIGTHLGSFSKSEKTSIDAEAI